MDLRGWGCAATSGDATAGDAAISDAVVAERPGGAGRCGADRADRADPGRLETPFAATTLASRKRSSRGMSSGARKGKKARRICAASATACMACTRLGWRGRALSQTGSLRASGRSWPRASPGPRPVVDARLGCISGRGPPRPLAHPRAVRLARHECGLLLSRQSE